MDKQNEWKNFFLEMYLEDDLQTVTITGNEDALRYLAECCLKLGNAIPGSHYHFTKQVLGTTGNLVDIVIEKK